MEWLSLLTQTSLVLLPALIVGCILNSRTVFLTVATTFLVGSFVGLIDLVALAVGLIWVYCCASRGEKAGSIVAMILVGMAGLYDHENRTFLLELEVVVVWGLMLGCSAIVPIKLKQERERTAERVACGVKMQIERRVQRTLHDQVARNLVHVLHAAKEQESDKLRSNTEAVLRHCQSALTGLKGVLVDTNAGDSRTADGTRRRCSETFWRAIRELESRLEIDARWDGTEDSNKNYRVEQILCEAIEELLFNAFKYADPDYTVKAHFSMDEAGGWTLRVKNRISQKPILDVGLRSRTGLAALKHECLDAGLNLEWGTTGDWWNAELKYKK